MEISKVCHSRFAGVPFPFYLRFCGMLLRCFIFVQHVELTLRRRVSSVECFYGLWIYATLIGYLVFFIETKPETIQDDYMNVVGSRCGRRLMPVIYCLAAVVFALLPSYAADAQTPVGDPGGSPSGIEEGGGIAAVDSDFLFLEIRPSSLPGVQGYGVFAKADIPQGEVLCEMRGPVVPEDAPVYSDKLFKFSSLARKEPLKVMVNNICAFINDCIDLATVNSTRKTPQPGDAAPVPVHDSRAHNAAAMVTKLGKVFIVSKKDISAGSEICYFYGW